ncbi:glycosyltransferase [Marivita sp. GX14005]|uniref:glycosyltransferase n=1 Tax=Marivita sp. GX14005 TaxID=2942276 RepID=UPI002019FFAC|nr:glycosyltransferase [Marivita sp. GX14005]MCL3883914.1 glycosyltransferase [Marivita sp. GX14005]
MSLRIAIVAHVRHPIAPPFKGGMEAFTWHLARALAAAGHRVTLLASGDSRAGLPGGVDLLPILDEHYDRRFPWHDYHGTDALNDHLDACFARAGRLLLEGDFDVIHNNCLHRFIPRLARERRLAMVTSLHIPPFGALRRAVEDSAAPWNLSAVTSRRQRGIWWPDGAPETAFAVHNGIDPEAWPFRPGGDGSAIWSGRITPTKGTHLAVQAARLADIPLAICGVIEHRDYFEDEIAPHLNARIRHLGHLPAADLARAYGQASALMFTPLWEEPFGLAAVEAMATGLPVAALGNGAAAEVIGEAGAIAQDDTPEALAEALRHALRIPPHLPRERVMERFTLSRMVARFETLYASAMSARAAPAATAAFSSLQLRLAPRSVATLDRQRKIAG